MVLKGPYPEVVIPEIAFSDHILKGLLRHGKRIAVVDAVTDREYSFDEIRNKSIALASAFAKRGLGKGDIVATCVTNSCEFLMVIIAAAACGATITTCNPLYNANELNYQFKHSGVKVVFTVPQVYNTVKEACKGIESVQKIYTIGHHAETQSINSLLEGEDGLAFPNTVNIDVHEDVVLMPYSSGTTGLPKGVMLTHRNIVSCITMFSVNPITYTSCWYIVLPLFHVFGLIDSINRLIGGGKQILDVRFNLETMFQCIEKYKVTGFSGVPPMLVAIAKSPLAKKYDLSSLRLIGSGGAPLPEAVANAVAEITGARILQGWGLTEAVPAAIAYGVVTPFHSIGMVTANTRIKFVDVNTRKELGPYQDGELLIKGPQVMKGYFKNPEQTVKTIDADGWLHTGDVGHYDEGEMIYIVDRLKELIKYKAFQVAPAELEAVLLSNPKVAEAAVIGIPDVEAGEIPLAFVVRKDPTLTEEEVKKYVEERVSKYKYLRGGVEFRQAIEKTPSGKILRRNLGEQYAKSAKSRM